MRSLRHVGLIVVSFSTLSLALGIGTAKAALATTGLQTTTWLCNDTITATFDLPGAFVAPGPGAANAPFPGILTESSDPSMSPGTYIVLGVPGTSIGRKLGVSKNGTFDCVLQVPDLPFVVEVLIARA